LAIGAGARGKRRQSGSQSLRVLRSLPVASRRNGFRGPCGQTRLEQSSAGSSPPNTSATQARGVATVRAPRRRTGCVSRPTVEEASVIVYVRRPAPGANSTYLWPAARLRYTAVTRPLSCSSVVEQTSPLVFFRFAHAPYCIRHGSFITNSSFYRSLTLLDTPSSVRCSISPLHLLLPARGNPASINLLALTHPYRRSHHASSCAAFVLNLLPLNPHQVSAEVSKSLVQHNPKPCSASTFCAEADHNKKHRTPYSIFSPLLSLLC